MVCTCTHEASPAIQAFNEELTSHFLPELLVACQYLTGKMVFFLMISVGN